MGGDSLNYNFSRIADNTFTQGEEMRRPGRVEVEVRPEAEPGKVRGWIGGAAVTVLRGELEL